MPRKGRLSVVPLNPNAALERPEPPEDLSPREAEVWRGAVRSMKAGWFTAACAPLLQAYCFEVTVCEQLAAELRTIPVDDKRYARVSSLHRQASKLMATLATRLRLTPHSNRSAKNGYDPSGGRPRPWEP